MDEEEKLDRLVSGLKKKVMLEVLKANPANLKKTSRIALNVDNILARSGIFGYGSANLSGLFGAIYAVTQAPQPMVVSNAQGDRHY